MPANTDSKKTPQWLALHFSQLALDEFNRGRQAQTVQAKTPLAIIDQQAGQRCIIACNRTAENAGVHTGMPVDAALGLADSLHITARDPHAETLALEHLAACCYQYSSQVSIAAGRNTLLLEAAASRRLFGAAEMLASRIRTALEQSGYHAASGIAPTPEAACLAARHGLNIHASEELRTRLGALSITSLPLDGNALKVLQQTGLRTLAEVLRLPRKALTRHLGPSACDYLDRLLGLRPDPRRVFRPPDSFTDGIDVPETTHTEGLLFPLKRLLQTLCGTLQARDRGVAFLEICLQLEKGTQTIDLHLQHASCSESHLMMLLRERLERLQLSGPVRRINLQAPHFLPRVVCQPGLLAATDPDPVENGIEALLERLQARLGDRCVQGLKGLEDHRPELSWSFRNPDEPAPCTALPQRPAWLFPEPRRCRIDQYRILTGPERIESGWWDGRDCRRDYFIVRDNSGSTLWAFHEYKPQPGWYLQGLFA